MTNNNPKGSQERQKENRRTDDKNRQDKTIKIAKGQDSRQAREDRQAYRAWPQNKKGQNKTGQDSKGKDSKGPDSRGQDRSDREGRRKKRTRQEKKEQYHWQDKTRQESI